MDWPLTGTSASYGIYECWPDRGVSQSVSHLDETMDWPLTEAASDTENVSELACMPSSVGQGQG